MSNDLSSFLGLSPSGIALIPSMYLAPVFDTTLTLFTFIKFNFHVLDFQHFGLRSTEETYFVEMGIWCIKIGPVYMKYNSYRSLHCVSNVLSSYQSIQCVSKVFTPSFSFSSLGGQLSEHLLVQMSTRLQNTFW